MPKRILIDAMHPEETRVVVLENGRVQEFDSETAVKKQLKGNIYLAKVTRVEPSLQAAFVDYGGDKHGFLSLTEIHPDYYNIPVDDKRQLVDDLRSKGEDDEEFEPADSGDVPDQDSASNNAVDEEAKPSPSAVKKTQKAANAGSNLYKRYKIQEVIKRNQIVLVQVEKEERGNKGASLTTFISLAGRYCVLMPNSIRRGGVSRRIASSEDRKRLKSIIKGLDIPSEAGLIVRTAGSGKNESELKDDYEYLVKLWDNIRQLTLSSAAPAFVHSEGGVVKRSVRDLFNDDVDEVLVEGKNTYNEAREFMNTLLPSQFHRLKRYKNKIPIFSRYRVEEQIASLYRQEAPLRSGGSVVITPTEALISIDVNSGKSTSQRNVEETAVSTNLEAAYEIARQLRLRDLSGLIVIDFIDMLDIKNRKAIERALRDACQDDRAKVQFSRISTFGLMEMSRQRLKPSFLEVNTSQCPNCGGVGYVKATQSVVVNVFRAIENAVSRLRKPRDIKVCVDVDAAAATYILNFKRKQVDTIESNYGVKIMVRVSSTVADGEFCLEISNDETILHKVSSVDKPSTFSADDEAGSVRRASANTSRRNSEDRGRNNREKEKLEKTDNSFKLLKGLWKKIIE